MNQARRLIILALGVSGLLTLSGTALAQGSYFSLICRGGRTMVNFGRTTTRVHFGAAKTVNRLNPGECQFADRILRSNEPTSLVLAARTERDKLVERKVIDCLQNSACYVKIPARASTSSFETLLSTQRQPVVLGGGTAVARIRRRTSQGTTIRAILRVTR
ncbi:MAG: hypothetical protein AAGA56_28830 [Myxococcota bacterium]